MVEIGNKKAPLKISIYFPWSSKQNKQIAFARALFAVFPAHELGQALSFLYMKKLYDQFLFKSEQYYAQVEVSVKIWKKSLTREEFCTEARKWSLSENVNFGTNPLIRELMQKNGFGRVARKALTLKQQ